MRKNPSYSNSDEVSASRRIFADLLWRAFPGPSERQVAHKAAKVLDVSERQVRNWLRCEHSAAWHFVFKVMAIAGAEVAFANIESRR